MVEDYRFVNGIASASPGVDDRGLNYGHGLFETMRLHAGEIPLWSWHRQRLADGLTRLGIDLDTARVENQLEGVLPQLPEIGVVKLVITGGESAHGYRPVPHTPPTIIIRWRPLPSASMPLAVQLCNYRLPINPVLAGVKHLNRLDQVMAARELDEGREGLLLDAGNRVVEGLSHNLFIRIEGRWATPVIDRAGVAGVMRRYLLDRVFAAAGLEVTETILAFSDITGADELFFCNAVSGILPVSTVDNYRGWQTWPETEVLKAALGVLQPCFTA